MVFVTQSLYQDQKTFSCKELFLREMISNISRRHFKFRYTCPRYNPSEVREAVKKIKEQQKNIPKDKRAVFTLRPSSLEVTVNSWWRNYYKLGWLALALRINLGNESFTPALEKAYNEFIAGKFTIPIRMTGFYNWRAYFRN